MTHRAGRSAVVLASGGLDSTTVLAIAASHGMRLHALTVQYGQKHAAELEAAKYAAARWAAEHRIVDLDLRAFGGSALTDEDVEVPEHDANGTGIPLTYVPARNTILLSLALAWAEVINAADIYIGVNSLDYSGYPDCRPEFIAAFESLANLATRAATQQGVRFTIHAPLIHLTKGQIIQRGVALGVDYGRTVSCYNAGTGAAACGRCDACALRLKGFAEAGIIDPVTYARSTR